MHCTPATGLSGITEHFFWPVVHYAVTGARGMMGALSCAGVHMAMTGKRRAVTNSFTPNQGLHVDTLTRALAVFTE